MCLGYLKKLKEMESFFAAVFLCFNVDPVINNVYKNLKIAGENMPNLSKNSLDESDIEEGVDNLDDDEVPDFDNVVPDFGDDEVPDFGEVKLTDSGTDEGKEQGILSELYCRLFGSSWEMWLGSILLATLSICLFVISSPWGSSGGLVNWGDNLFGVLGASFGKEAVDIVDNKYAMLSLLMLIGAFGAALMSKEFSVRVSPIPELGKGIFGGLLMGLGCVLGMGCTVGNFFSGFAALSGGAIVFVIGLLIGVFLAVKYLLWEMEKHPNWSSGKSWTFLKPKTEGRSLQPLIGVVVLLLGGALALTYDAAAEKVLIGFVLIGLLIGIILQRSRWCIVRALRETFMTGDATPTMAIIAGIVVGTIGFTTIKAMGIRSEMTMVAANFWVPAIVGGIIFGFGMTIAGGCTVGSTWRAAEGHVKLWFSLLGIVIAGPLTAEYIKPEFLDMLPASMNKQVFLPEHFTYTGSFIIMMLILLLWYIFVNWNERTGKLSAL